MAKGSRYILGGEVIPIAVVVVALLAVGVYSHSLISWRENPHSNQDVLSLFQAWMEKHHKKYEDHQEKLKRFQIFKSNKEYIDKKNKDGNEEGQPPSYKLGLTKFADLSNDEFKTKYFGTTTNSSGAFAMRRILRRASNNNSTNVVVLVSGSHGYNNISNDGLRTTPDHQSCNTNSLSSTMDWRSLGVVTPVKDQGYCGSCWAFSSVGAIESANAISLGKLYSLSEQELVSCDTTNHGCNGGYVQLAFKWVIENGGLDTEDDYPYTSWGKDDGTCTIQKEKIKVASISSYMDVQSYNEEALWCAVAKTPVAVAINGDSPGFQFYSSGVFTGGCLDSPYDLNHAVLIVGWGMSNQYDYWIVKNSWGTSWGMNGYMHIVRNTQNTRGLCGINSNPSYPTISSMKESL